MPQSDPSKTESATAKRRKKSRDEGNVPRSQELSKLAVILVGLLVLRLLIGFIGDEMKSLFASFLSNWGNLELTTEGLYILFVDLAVHLAKMLLPVLFSLALAAFVINRIQVGQLWTTKVFKPKMEKFVNIVGGIKRLIFNVDAFVRLARSILGAAAVAIGPIILLRHEMNNLLPLFSQTTEGIAVYMLTVSYKMVLYSLIPMITVAVIDTVYTRWDYEEKLKMTKDEVKDERKQAEGDPKIRQRQKQKMMAMSMSRMLHNVPKADVVVTNPTHFAVALSYDLSKAPAPLVVAKGADHMAKRIREMAREAGVPIRENKPLARALYDQVEVGDIIPEDLYKAVATILARLHKFRKKRAG
ncbi:flagellar biosynthesis protein FlhB [Desulfocurvibacter africanus]|uniref:Flagellar biosynthetic protein FlhB n=1 Tax=Desulfocurvibacter africanus subsp. africanus str. Walvis Bay TaxID=690850 RepID=F3YTU8_DESAF|nr:flagellar biosynthesis protein FlhB [Desulfocurvibacter africanus]EGJ48479.1 flagellar biosynthetic protein FlhB [Desulfocurvibacter africanus subsp. africanus str. Walvis Bay]